MEIRAEILNFVRNDLLNGADKFNLTPATELIQSGVIDSLGIMKLLSFLEEKFSIRIAGEYLLPENFETVDKICSLIEKLLSQTGIGNEF